MHKHLHLVSRSSLWVIYVYIHTTSVVQFKVKYNLRIQKGSLSESISSQSVQNQAKVHAAGTCTRPHEECWCYVHAARMHAQAPPHMQRHRVTYATSATAPTSIQAICCIIFPSGQNRSTSTSKESSITARDHPQLQVRMLALHYKFDIQSILMPSTAC